MLYETKDIDEGAYIGCQDGVRFKEALRKGYTVFFQFESDRSMIDMADSFYKRKGLVEPKAYSQWQGDLRDIVRRSKSR